MITIACHWWNNSVFWIRTVSTFMEYSALDPTEGHILHFIDESQWERLKFTQQICSTLQIRSQRFLHLAICSFYHLHFSFSAMVFGALQGESRVMGTSWIVWDLLFLALKANPSSQESPLSQENPDGWSLTSCSVSVIVSYSHILLWARHLRFP